MKILLVQNDGGYLADNMRDELSVEVDFEPLAGSVTNKKSLDYDVAIIDASDDIPVKGFISLSEYLRAEKPKMLIIGSSIGGANFMADKLAQKLYDERTSFPDIDTFKRLMENHGFTFPNNGGIN